MNDEAGLTIGQEFAARWMARCWQSVQRKVESKGRSAESLSRDIADAIDEIAKEKREQLQPLIKDVLLQAAEGNKEAYREVPIGGENVGVSAQEFLKERRLVYVANKYTLGGVQTWEFPV